MGCQEWSGNAAGTGARIALLDSGSRDEIGALVERVEKAETALEGDFQRHFVQAMAIPHKSDAFAALGKAMTLPQTSSADGGRKRPTARNRGRP